MTTANETRGELGSPMAALALLALITAFAGGLALAYLYPPPTGDGAPPSAQRIEPPKKPAEGPVRTASVAAVNDQRGEPSEPLARLEQAVVALTARLAAQPDTGAVADLLNRLDLALARLEMAASASATEVPGPAADKTLVPANASTPNGPPGPDGQH